MRRGQSRHLLKTPNEPSIPDKFNEVMSNFGLTAVEAVGLTIPENLSNDPVTKAVYDNILGNIPTIPTKKKVTVYCDICSLEFSSQVVLDTHLAGSKHQRKLKSKELMKNLEETESGFERNTVSGVIRCTVCDITVNSPQLLATHVAGNKHKSKRDNKAKRENGEEGGTPAKKVCSGATGQSNGTKSETKGDGTNSVANAGGAGPPKKKERPPLQLNIPSCVTKLEDTKSGGKFLCNPCQAHCNSDVQLSQHLSSKKHLEKVSGKKKTPPSASTSSTSKGSGRGSGWRGGLFGKGRGSSSVRGGSSSKWDSLSSSSALLSSSLTGSYGSQSTFPDSSLTNSYTDSYGLSSLGRSSATDYNFNRSSSSSTTARGSGARASVSATYGRGDTYARSEGGYGRTTSAYGRTEVYPRTEYAAEYPTTRTDELTYSRAATEYATQGYGGAEYGHGYATGHAAPRGMPFTYTQPLSSNFVSGGSIL